MELKDNTLPTFNAGWYRIASTQKIKKNKIYTFNYFDTSFVCYRNSDNLINLFNAYCPHLGAHLGGGKLMDNKLICPFHGWKYDSDGACVEIPYCKTIPKRARLKPYLVKVIHSTLFCYFDPDCTVDSSSLINDNDLAEIENFKIKSLVTINIDAKKLQMLTTRIALAFQFKILKPGFMVLEDKYHKFSLRFLVTSTPTTSSSFTVNFALLLAGSLNPLRIFNVKKLFHKKLRLMLNEVG